MKCHFTLYNRFVQSWDFFIAFKFFLVSLNQEKRIKIKMVGEPYWHKIADEPEISKASNRLNLKPPLSSPIRWQRFWLLHSCQRNFANYLKRLKDLSMTSFGGCKKTVRHWVHQIFYFFEDTIFFTLSSSYTLTLNMKFSITNEYPSRQVHKTVPFP